MAGTIKGITIEIGADTTKLTSALSGVEKSLKSTQSALSKINTSLKFDPGNVNLLRDKFALLSEKIEATKSKLQTLKEAQRQMDASGVDKNSQEYQALQREIDITESKLKGLNKEMVEFGSVGAQRIALLGEKLQAVGEKMQAVGRTLSTYVTLPLVAAGAKAVKSFAEVDKTMTLANKTMGNTEEEAKALSNAMKAAASNSTYGMNDAATAALNFARAGLDAEQAASAMAPAMNLAAGEGGNLDTVSAGLIGTINGFGDSFDNTTHYADVFAAACNNSALDVDSLSDAMGVAAPVFKTAGKSVNDAALYMGVMANANIDANTSANALKTGLMRLADPAKGAKEAMEKYGIAASAVWGADGSMNDAVDIQKNLHDSFARLTEQEQLAAASAIFGKNQGAAWLALINTAPESVNALADSIGNCQGVTEEMANAMMSGFGGSLEKLKSSIDVAVYSLGEALAPTISKVAERIQEAIDRFNSLDDSQRQMIARIGLLAAALGPALVILGKLTSGLGGLMAMAPRIVGVMSNLSTVISGAAGSLGGLSGVLTALAGPVGIAIAAIGILVGMITTLWNTNEDFRNKITEIWSEVTATFDEASRQILDAINSLGFDFESVSEAIKTAWTALCEIFAPAFEGNFKAVTTILRGVMQLISGIIQTWCGIINGDWSQAWNGMKTMLLGIFNTITAPIQGIMTGISQAFKANGVDIKQTLSNVATATAERLAFMKETAAQRLSDMSASVKAKMSEIHSGISERMTSAAVAVSNKITEMKNAWNSSDFGITVNAVWGVVEKTSKDKMNAIQTAFSTHGGGMKGIAAATGEALKQHFMTSWTFMDNFTGGKLTAIAARVNAKMSDEAAKVSEKLESAKLYFNEKWTAASSTATAKLTAIASTVTGKMSDVANVVSQKLELVAGYFTSKWSAALSTATSKLAAIASIVTSKMSDVANVVSQKLELVAGYFTSKLSAALSTATSKLSSIASTVTSKMSEVASTVSSKLESVKSYFSSHLESARSTASSKLNEISKYFDDKMGSVADAVSSAMASVKKNFSDGLSSAYKTVQEKLAEIKKFFDKLELKINLKVPHVKLSGGKAPWGIGGEGELPSFHVDWYDKGGIFSSPTIIGVGEKRPEFVGALDDLREIVREESGGGPLMQEMVRLMTILVEQGGRPITVNQEIHANNTSYAEQQKQAARQFKNIARALT